MQLCCVHCMGDVALTVTTHDEGLGFIIFVFCLYNYKRMDPGYTPLSRLEGPVEQEFLFVCALGVCESWLCTLAIAQPPPI